MADMDASAGRRRQLVKQLAQQGDLITPAWRKAFEAIPREVFVPDRILLPQGDPVTHWAPVVREEEPERWLDLVYSDQSLVTQLDGSDANTTTGAPTSSSTLPGLVMRMFEALDVHDDQKVLEIGTGTGYSTAILSERVAPANVVSVEVDPAVARRAAAAITSLGYIPTLAVADGLAGYPRGAPYDRIIATCSVRAIPRDWLEQARIGAKLLVPMNGWLDAAALVQLTVEPERSIGRFLPGEISFMPARAHATPSDNWWPRRPDDEQTRPSPVGGDIFQSWTARWVAQLAAPAAIQTWLMDTDPPTVGLRSWVSDSYAFLHRQGDAWNVTQPNGTPKIWDPLERAVTAWRAAGSPTQDQFQLRIDATGQWIELPGNADLSWQLP